MTIDGTDRPPRPPPSDSHGPTGIVLDISPFGTNLADLGHFIAIGGDSESDVFV